MTSYPVPAPMGDRDFYELRRREGLRDRILKLSRSECDDLIADLTREHGEAGALQAFAELALAACKNVKLTIEHGGPGARARVARFEAADGRRIVREPARSREDEVRQRAVADARAFLRHGPNLGQRMRAWAQLEEAGLSSAEIQLLLGRGDRWSDDHEGRRIDKYELARLVEAARRGWRPKLPDPEPAKPVPAEQTATTPTEPVLELVDHPKRRRPSRSRKR